MKSFYQFKPKKVTNKAVIVNPTCHTISKMYIVLLFSNVY